ncbi:MAG: hypothetical protein KAS75_02210 [Planctomycetes bacterium]|nr:hypothetical protein [Planctomycetota bacterium]
MRYKDSKTQLCSGMTFLEVVIAMVIMTIIFTAILPLTRGIQNSWNSKKGSTETLQNGRVLTEHLTRNLSKASEITAVSEASETNGFIEYLDNDGSTMRYDVNNSYVEFGPVGNLSTLAGPVSQLQFTCYNILNLDTPIADVNNVTSIRFVRAEATMSNPSEMAQDKTFTASAFLYTNANPATEESYDPNLVAYYPFEGNYNNVITGQAADPCGTTGIVTDPSKGLVLDQPYAGTNKIFGDYLNCGNDAVRYIDTAVTVAAWVKLPDPGKSGVAIVSKGYAWKLVVDGSSASFRIDHFDLNPPGEYPVGEKNICDGQWHHIAGTFNGIRQCIYIDGQLEESISRTGTINPYDQYVFWIGGEVNRRISYIGLIDDVCVYDDALDANEVLDLYLNGPSVDEGSGETQVLP